MATALNTTEFVFATDIALLAAATRKDFSAITLDLPEGSKTFVSVTAEVTVYDEGLTAGNLTSRLIGMKLGAAAFSDVTETFTIANSGEAQGYVFHQDFTSYFNTNWSGSSMTCQVGVQFGGVATQNISVKLIIKYTLDTTSTTTTVKTVRIPLDSTLPTLNNTWQEIDTNGIPAITGGFLPEASVSVKQVWLEIGQLSRSGTGSDDHISSCRVNGGTQRDYFDEEGALQSARYARSIVDITSEDLSAARSLELTASATGRTPQRPAVVVCVTYTCTVPSATDPTFVSMQMGAFDMIGTMPAGATSSDPECWARDIVIPEASPVLKQSGVILYGVSDNPSQIEVKVGAQASYTLHDNLSSTSAPECGNWTLGHRIDGGGVAGAFATLAQGRNEYKISAYCDDAADQLGQLNGVLLLNYTCTVPTAGYWAVTRSHYHPVSNMVSGTEGEFLAASVPTIPETNYWLTGVVVYAPIVMDNDLVQALVISTEVKSGEGAGAGWEPLYAGIALAKSENNMQTIYGAARSVWRRFPGDPAPGRLDFLTSRRYQISAPNGVYANIGLWYTYHSITIAKTGSLTGYVDADGAGLTVHVWNWVTKEYLGSCVTTAGGNYSFTWYDGTEAVLRVVVEDSTHFGCCNPE